MVLNRKFQKHQETLDLDFSTLQITDPPNSNYKAILFTLLGTHTKIIDINNNKKQSFILKVLTTQIPAPEYEIHKNILTHKVEVLGIKDKTLKQEIENGILGFANTLSDWTNNNMWGTSEQFYALHFLAYVFSKISGRFYTNGYSCFLDFSAKDLHFSKQDSDPIQDYYADLPVQSPRYFAITVSEKFFQEFLLEFFNRKKRLNLLEYMELFPEFDGYSESMNVFEASDLLPDLMKRFSGEERISLEFNPKNPIQEGVDYSKKNIKVNFHQNSVDLLIPLIFDIVIGKTLFTWEPIGQGYLGIGGITQINQFKDGSLNFDIKSKIRLQELYMTDTETQKRIEDNASIIKVLGNLFIKENLSPPQTYHADPKLLLDLNWGNFNIVEYLEKKVKMRFIEGYFEMIVDELDTDKFPQDLGLVNKFGGVSGGFSHDQNKRKTAWENKQKRLEKEAKLREEQALAAKNSSSDQVSQETQ
ncbi:UNKNOWN [Stylonychia lemnae]|uniref:Uncharacterized protein n=1 Tax=Stylonychia lemnae TaxID=5949 RepID=A0A078B1I9_STYLE|nr:UNKNOWN [Stylonychia lemnae]|eukprot:CDW87202.1 UNKNOWN [Stylonychia lemnae]